MDYTKFIDSIVGNIARKIEDEFNENDHPRDKGGKFTSKGGEGKGGVKEKQKERRGYSELEETESEKAAKEELGEEDIKAGKETDKIVEEFKGSGIDMYAALSDLGIDVQHTPEAYHEDVFKEKLFNDPKFRKKAKEYIKQYRGAEDEEEWFK